jgi:hypothetical protein
MSKVTNILDRQPHLQGEAVCMGCGYTWQAVAPVGVYELECDKCGTMKGIYKYPIVGETYWECNCGSRYFSVSGITNSILCVKCGTPQEFP